MHQSNVTAIYPDNLKIKWTIFRNMLRERCMSTLGKSQVDAMEFSIRRYLLVNEHGLDPESREHALLEENSSIFHWAIFYGLLRGV